MTNLEKFCLKWNDFETNISSLFGSMREDQDFSDVTLAVDGGINIEAHKVILAASSSLFSTLLKQNKHTHPLLYMRGIQTKQLNAVVDFIYHGEVNILQEDLDDFLNLAKELQLKGLNNPKEANEEHIQQPSQKHTKSSRTKAYDMSYEKKNLKGFVENITDDRPVEHFDQVPEVGFEETAVVPMYPPVVKATTNYEDLDETINSMIEKLEHGGKFACKVCGKIEYKDKFNMKSHIEAKHIEGVTHPCNQCGKSFRSRNSLSTHMSVFHTT